MSLLKELWAFMKVRKKWWLAPIILIMLVNGLFNLVDAWFLGVFVGAEALTAVTLMFPLFMMLIATATVVGNGFSSVMARLIGANRPRWILGNAFASAVLLSLVFSVILIVCFLAVGDDLIAVVANGSQTLAGMGYVYIAILVFVLFSLTSIDQARKLLDRHFQGAVAEAVRVSPANGPIVPQIEGRVARLLNESPWIRWGDVEVDVQVFSADHRTTLERLPRYQERGLPFRAWLYRLASSRVNRWARRRPLEPVAIEAEPRGEVAETRDVLADLARHALLELPARYQSALALHYLEGLSVDEVARVTGTRPGTIKARLARGRKRLKRALEPHVQEFLR